VAGPDGCPITLPLNQDPMNSVCSFVDIRIFGDSLEDTESSASVNSVCDLPFYPCLERFSNGPLYVDFIAAALAVGPLTKAFDYGTGQFVPGGNNYAVAGAEARPGQSTTDLTVDNQVLLYQGALGLGVDPFLTMQRLHFLQFGGNDIINSVYAYVLVSLQGGDGRAAAQQVVDLALLGVSQILQSLLDTPQVCNVLMNGLPDASSLPRILEVAQFYGALGLTDVLTVALDVSLLYNGGIQTLVETQFAPLFETKCGAGAAEFGIRYGDTFSYAEDAIAASGLGYRNDIRACNDRHLTTGDACSAVGQAFGLPFSFIPLSLDNSTVGCVLPTQPNESLECECDGLLYFDEFHPSTAFGQAIADFALQDLESFCAA